MEHKYVNMTDVTSIGSQIDNFILYDQLSHQGISHIFDEMRFIGWMWSYYIPEREAYFYLIAEEKLPFSLS